MTESETQLQVGKVKITTALSNNAQIIVEAIPELEKIIGNQPVVSKLPALESKNRFVLVLKTFISVFASETPLILFLDNLQWADLDSLKLISLLSISSSYLFLFGAYRSNEISATHPLTSIMDEIKEQEIANLSSINLPTLKLRDINNLIADSFKCSLTDCLPLAQLTHLKIQGNPFFINEFLQSLYTDNLLYFDNQICK